ncbi:MAG: hypothetical protein ABJN65_16540 [Parasphingorhabdus sp.]
MRKIILATSVAALTLSACSQELSEQEAAKFEQSADMASDDIAEAEQAPASQESPAEQSTQPFMAPATNAGEIAESEASDEPHGRASMPDFTYTYAYKYEAPGSELGRMQDAHLAACDEMGEQQCKLANYSQDMKGVAGAEAKLELYVASDKIRDLATKMANIAHDFDGERVEANIIGTDATRRLDQAQLQVTNNLTQKERLEEIINDRRSNRLEKQQAREQLATLMTSLNANQRQLDNVASQLGFTKMEVSYSSSSLFGPILPYALIILLIAAIAGLVYRSKQVKFAEPVAA